MNNDRFKFRVWDNEYRQFWGAKECHLYLDGDGKLLEDEMPTETVEPGRFIVEQCTGLHDRNGKLIYEGDVIERTYDMFGREKYIFSVVWYQGKLVLLSSPNAAPVLVWDNLGYEVVGNIHEVKHE